MAGWEGEPGGVRQRQPSRRAGALDQLLDGDLDRPGAGGGPAEHGQRPPVAPPPPPSQPGDQDQRHQDLGGAEVGDEAHGIGQPRRPVGDQERLGGLVDQAGRADPTQQHPGDRPDQDQGEQRGRQRRGRRGGIGQDPSPPAAGLDPAHAGTRHGALGKPARSWCSGTGCSPRARAAARMGASAAMVPAWPVWRLTIEPGRRPAATLAVTASAPGSV